MHEQMGNPPQLTPFEEIMFKAWAAKHGVQEVEDPAQVAQLKGEYKASGGRGMPSPQMPEMEQPEGPSITHTLMRREGEPTQTKVTMKTPNPTPQDIDAILQMMQSGVVSGPDAVQELKLDPSRMPQNPMQGDVSLPNESGVMDPRLRQILTGQP